MTIVPFRGPGGGPQGFALMTTYLDRSGIESRVSEDPLVSLVSSAYLGGSTPAPGSLLPGLYAPLHFLFTTYLNPIKASIYFAIYLATSLLTGPLCSTYDVVIWIYAPQLLPVKGSLTFAGIALFYA